MTPFDEFSKIVKKSQKSILHVTPSNQLNRFSWFIARFVMEMSDGPHDTKFDPHTEISSAILASKNECSLFDYRSRDYYRKTMFTISL